MLGAPFSPSLTDYSALSDTFPPYDSLCEAPPPLSMDPFWQIKATMWIEKSVCASPFFPLFWHRLPIFFPPQFYGIRLLFASLFIYGVFEEMEPPAGGFVPALSFPPIVSLPSRFLPPRLSRHPCFPIEMIPRTRRHPTVQRCGALSFPPRSCFPGRSDPPINPCLPFDRSHYRLLSSLIALGSSRNCRSRLAVLSKLAM